ncbi:DUF2358 domain containing protein [Nitzschia inconspicua]|uniref:DUF2358 domain containing protein n=1 Tax=Nitzschia inconspicua TaxID=303405 RepID=A0A9K3Q6U3_9STRA|nr:DUF2358 domain containing protein [Nitzschia inconspicua]
MWFMAAYRFASVNGFQPERPQLTSPRRSLQVANADFSSSNNTMAEIHKEFLAQPRDAYLQSSSRTKHWNSHQDFNVFERWCLSRLETWYAMSQRVKCPFFRRRYGDGLDHLEWVLRHLVIRRSCCDAMGPAQACRSIDNGYKSQHLPVQTIVRILESDWEGKRNSNGYYVTGILSSYIYRDDCLFTSPDPDLPIRGLRKYLGVASHLFDSKTSSSQLLSLKAVENSHPISIQATWRMQLTIRLPWKPKLPSLMGSTTYYLDDENLIYHHHETWDRDVSVLFWAIFIPHEEPQGKDNVAPDS